MLRCAAHASSTQGHREPQLQPRLLREEHAHAVRQRLLHRAVKLSDSLPRKRGRHRTQKVHHAAVGGAQPDEHVDHLRVVKRGQWAQRVRDGLGGELGDELSAEGLVPDGRAE